MLRPDENIPAAIGRMGALLTAPVVTDLLVPDGWETADGPLPDLYAGQVGSAVVRGRGALPEVCEGRNAQGQAIKLPLTARVSMSPAVPLLWAQKRIRGLESRRDLVAAVPLAKEFNLICQGTAFVAWDEVEHVAVANQRVYQPSLDPASWECFARHPRLMRAICLNDVEVRDVFHMHHQESEDLFQSETPLPRPVWARHSLFSSPGGDQIVELLTDWLKSLAAIRRLWAERRLKKLINAVEREFQQDPAAQLQALTQRLGSLIGKLGPFAERLQGILQVASW
jgi:hypothetical protein